MISTGLFFVSRGLTLRTIVFCAFLCAIYTNFYTVERKKDTRAKKGAKEGMNCLLGLFLSEAKYVDTCTRDS